MGHLGILNHLGLTNQTAGHTLGELQSIKVNLVGKCKEYNNVMDENSKPDKNGKKRYKKVICGFETTNKSIDVCPKCKRTLFWQKVIVD